MLPEVWLALMECLLVHVCRVLCSTSEELDATCDSDETDLDNTKMTMLCWHVL